MIDDRVFSKNTLKNYQQFIIISDSEIVLKNLYGQTREFDLCFSKNLL
jgi:hypothetical protein